MPRRAAETQSDSEIRISDLSQEFELREGDEEALFSVIEITGEKNGNYKVRWEGNDPKTRKPWPQSWVPKRDCTEDLVLTWKRKKKEKEKRNAKKNGRISTSSNRPSRSVASTSRTKSSSESIAASSNATKRRNKLSSIAGPSNVKSRSKHRFEEDSVKEEEESEGLQERPVSAGRSNAKSPTPGPPPSGLLPKGTKRKLAEAQSANTSVNQPSSRRIEAVPVEVDSDEGQTTRVPQVIFSNPPRKKRRITSEERPPTRTLQGEKKAVRNSGGKLRPHVTPNDEEEDEDEDEASDGAVVEEGMVEVLSDSYHSAGMNNPSDKPRNRIVDHEKKDKGKNKIVHLPLDEDEDESEVEIVEAPAQPRQPAQPKTASIIHVGPKRPSGRMTNSTGPVPSKGPSARITVSTGPVPSKRPSARMMVQPSPNRKAPSSNTHQRQAVPTTGVPDLGSKAVNTTRPAATAKKPKDSSFVAQSSTDPNRKPFFEPDSDSDRPPPLEWHRKPPRPQPAAKPLRNEGSDVDSVQILADPDNQANLSPRSRQRLELFDVEVMGKKTRVDEKKRGKEVDGRGEGSTLKRSSSSGNGRPATSIRPTPRFDTTNMDVVPETELENSQEDKLQPPSIAPENRNAAAAVSSIDSSTVGPSNPKSLQPIPVMSPSTFHPHLQPPNSSLPETIVEPSSSHERQPESDAIEQFESPEKERIPHTKRVVVLNKNGVVAEAREPEIVPRGQEIAEQVEASRRRVSTSSVAESSPEPTKKKSIQEVVASAQSRNRSEGNPSEPDESDDEKQQGEEEGVANASTSVVPPASGPPALSQDQSPPEDDVSQPMRDDLVDFNGDMDVGGPEELDQTHDDIGETPAGINPELLRQEEEESAQDLMADLRQEEEESTQDLMADLRQHKEQMEGMIEIDPTEGWDLGPPPVDAPSSRLGSINGETRRPNALVLAEEPKIASRLTSSRSVNQEDDDAPRGPITRSRSRSKTPSVLTNSRTKPRGKKKPLSIPSPVPSRRESPEPEEPLKSPVDVFQNVQGPSAASSILAAQILTLQTQVREKEAKIDSQQQALDSLCEQLRSSEDRNALLEGDGQRQLSELRSQWADEKLAWESERTLLTAQSAASEQSRIQADQDREFVREQYANASAYVTTVREENKELELRAKIAEEQSKKGVELVKATFEARVAKLQDEAKAWRRMGEFVIEKDTRTNDDIRRRAAEEPELRALCVRQQKALKEVRAKVDGLQADLQEKSNMYDVSTQELEHCKRENARLHSDLNEALIKLDRLGRSGDESTQGDDHEFVYRCMWRVETDNIQSACPEVFAAMRELEQHIYSCHLAQH